MHLVEKIKRSLIQEEQRTNENKETNDNTESEQVFYSKDRQREVAFQSSHISKL